MQPEIPARIQNANAGPLGTGQTQRLFSYLESEARDPVAVLIRGGRVVDPSQRIDRQADVLITGDRITEIGASVQAPEGVAIIDAGGLVVAPAFIDAHVHLRDPGFPKKETLETGARAALRGGYASICCMPNTNPALDNAERIADIVERARSLPVRVFPVGAISVGRRGETVADLEGMAAAGAVGFSDDGDSTRSGRVMRDALERAASLGRRVMVHCDEWTLAAGGVMNEGAVSHDLGLPGTPAAAEEIIIARDIELARLTGGRLHIQHVSTARGRALVHQAKRDGLDVSAEVTPHHLLMTEEWVAGRRRFAGEREIVPGPCPDPNARVNPPLRTERDAMTLLAGLVDGTFDIVATDHAPHAVGDKPDDLALAAPGMIGLELALPLMLRLVRSGRLSLPVLIEAMSTRPARIFGLPGGTLRPGNPADVVVFDPDARWVVDGRTIVSRSKNTPLTGMTMTGAVIWTIVGGEVRYHA